MARAVLPLTATQIEKAKPGYSQIVDGKRVIVTDIKEKEKFKPYRLFDGRGLYLEVRPNGGKWWRLKYRYEGKEKLVSLGTYPDVSLEDAREERAKKRKMLQSDTIVDPIKEDRTPLTLEEAIDKFSTPEDELLALELKLYIKRFREQTEHKTNGLTFKQLTEWYVDKKNKERRKAETDTRIKSISETHINRMLKGWKKDVYPLIGEMSANTVETDHIKEILSKMSDRGVSESARKVYSSINTVYKIGISNSHRTHIKSNPCSDIVLEDLLGVKSSAHYPIITKAKDLKALLLNIDNYSGSYSIKMGLKLLSFTFVRPQNIRFARWENINIKDKLWTIPGSQMKNKHELLVPLAPNVIKLLEELYLFSGDGDLLFPGLRGKNSPLSDASLVNALRRMGYTKDELVAHSFRGIFSTIAHEKSKFDHHVIEKQLAHSIGNKVSQAYNRSEYLDDRVKLMKWWDKYLTGIKNG